MRHLLAIFLVFLSLDISYQLDCSSFRNDPTCGNHNTGYKLQCQKFTNCEEVEVDDGCELDSSYNCKKKILYQRVKIALTLEIVTNAKEFKSMLIVKLFHQRIVKLIVNIKLLNIAHFPGIKSVVSNLRKLALIIRIQLVEI